MPVAGISSPDIAFLGLDMPNAVSRDAGWQKLALADATSLTGSSCIIGMVQFKAW
jgi:hypothetical protein